MAQMAANTYGKSRVRVVKLDRRPDGVHVPHEYTVQILLEGDFDASYTKSDNSLVVPTDTMKNTVYVISNKHDFSSPEEYGILVAEHMVKMYSHVSKASVHVKEDLWQRITVNGKPHEHSFVRVPEIRTAHVQAHRNGPTKVVSGVENLTVMKSTRSGFVGFHKCPNTTLPEVTDRFFSTTLKGHWTYVPSAGAVNYNEIYEKIKAVFLNVFATEFSPSVQATIWSTGQKVIEQNSAVNTITLSLPNNHINSLDMSRFGVAKNTNTFVPICEPFGDISSTVRRVSSKL